MGIKAFFDYFYEGGKRASDWMGHTLAPEMAYSKSKKVSTAIDVGGGGLLTYFAGLNTLGSAVTALAAVTTILTAPVTLIPAAIGTLAVSVFLGGIDLVSTVYGIGMLSSAMDKLNVPKPKGVVAEVTRAVDSTIQTVAKPFKWAGLQLSNAFKKAHDGKSHDGKSKAPKASPNSAPKIGGDFVV